MRFHCACPKSNKNMTRTPEKWDKILTSKNEASRFLKIYLPVSLLLSVGTSPDVLYNKIHNAVSEFLTFSQQNLLTLNFSITFFMIFSRLSSSVVIKKCDKMWKCDKKSSNNEIFGVFNWWKPVVEKPFKCYSWKIK